MLNGLLVVSCEPPVDPPLVGGAIVVGFVGEVVVVGCVVVGSEPGSDFAGAPLTR